MLCECKVVFFFFSSRRRHTRSLCDWSSDVCSSDLGGATNVFLITSGKWPFSDNDATKIAGEILEGYSRVTKFALKRAAVVRSEERRVGKECRCRGAA